MIRLLKEPVKKRELKGLRRGRPISYPELRTSNRKNRRSGKTISKRRGYSKVR